MVTMTVIDREGVSHEVQADVGDILMHSLRDHGFVEAACGGQCACATCHVYVESDAIQGVSEPTEIEVALLESSLESNEKSRLSCQLSVNESFDGALLRIPEEG